MRRAVILLLGPTCALFLLLFCFRAVLFEGEQFAFRDAANYYYPLYLRVQQEWWAGRWPLWDPWQNGGQPLLASPMAAVLYPGKLLYAAFPYAWGARLYVVGHTGLAFVGMMVLARSLGVSRVGASLSGLTYAFGAPVLFQYCNVIYLVGASWLPWGLCATDRLVRLRRPSGVLGLSAVLAMQVLGGDPQSAFLTVLCGAGYVAVLALRERERPSRVAAWPLGLALVGGWVVATAAFAYWRPSVPGWVGPIWMPALLAWMAAGGWIVRRRPGLREGWLGPSAGLAGAAVLAMALSAAVVIPAAEFTRLGNRMGEVQTLTLSKFSLEPYRLFECVWPGVFGLSFPENQSWIQAIPPATDRQLWSHSLYIGGLAPLLLLSAAGFRRVPPWRAWLTAVAVVSLLASLGRFGSPLWWIRWVPWAESALGPHDPLYAVPRADSYLEDGAGSPYALLAAAFPGFGLFRYSAKLLTITAAAVAVLAGAGWDEMTAGRSRRLAIGSALGLVVSALALGMAVALAPQAIALLSGRLASSALSGPPDARGAWAATQLALAHGVSVFAIGLGLSLWGPRRPHRAGAVALLVVAADLGLANSRLIWTVPQSIFDRKPEVVRGIEAAERAEPSPGPFRIHRMALWHPVHFLEQRSPDRIRELAEWEYQTLQGLNGLPWGVESSVSAGMLELDDYLLLFRPRIVLARPETAGALEVLAGSPIFYYPRRSYDLLGARYFVLPIRSDGWGSDPRGYAAFVPNTQILHPDPVALGDEVRRGRWAYREDWQLLRNRTAYPRAWVVRHAVVLPPADDPEARDRLGSTLAYQADAFWSEPGRPVADPRNMAWIETRDPEAIRGYVDRSAVEPGESVSVTRHGPHRVELQARLNRPGLVILADTYYPGWRLTIDGNPAPILRANRMMRGAAVPAGEHTLVYVYDPWSFRTGLVVSLAGLTTLLVLLARLCWSRSARRSPPTDAGPALGWPS